MILGVDIGTASTKAVLMDDSAIAWQCKIATNANPEAAVAAVLSALQAERTVDRADLEKVVVTGWGQNEVADVAKCDTVASVVRGALWNTPSARTVLCMGAQESLVVSLDPRGRVLGYARNDRCAAGAGRFLEIICEPLECSVDATAEVASKADRKLQLSTQCAVFAESEVVSLVNDGESVANIMDGILGTIARNVITLCKKVNKQEDFVVAGGLARNERILRTLQDALDVRLHRFGPEPEYICAVGAALAGGRS